MNRDAEPAWVTVRTPGKKPRRRPGIGGTTKSRVHKNMLVEFLRNPDPAFDGSNSKLGAALGLSARQASRLVNQLEGEGKLKLEFTLYRTSGGGVYTKRMIQVVKENH